MFKTKKMKDEKNSMTVLVILVLTINDYFELSVYKKIKIDLVDIKKTTYQL